MPSKAARWGNSIGIRLPAYVVERTGIRPGDYVYVRLVDSGDIVIRPVSARDIPVGYLPVDAAPNATTKVPTGEEVPEKW